MSNDFGLRDYLDVRFKSVEDRLERMEDRQVRIETAGPRAGAFGAAGTFLGALVVMIASALGVRPPGQQ